MVSSYWHVPSCDSVLVLSFHYSPSRLIGFFFLNCSVIFDLLKNTTDTARGSHTLSAIQILGVIVANKIEPYNAASCSCSKIQ